MATDQATFEALLSPVLPVAYRTAHHMTRGRADAEDAVQQAAFLAWRAFGSYQEGTNFRAWFLRIVTNVCRSEFRRLKRAPTNVSLDQPDIGEAVIPQEVTRERGDQLPDMSLIAQLDAQEIAAALAGLPEEYRTVATLYFVDDLPYQEIAEVVGCPIGTVRSRLHRGRRLLQQKLIALATELGIASGSEQDEAEALAA